MGADGKCGCPQGGDGKPASGIFTRGGMAVKLTGRVVGGWVTVRGLDPTVRLRELSRLRTIEASSKSP